MDMHGMHELGVFDFALAVAFLVGAVRPRLASGLAWPCCAAAFGLVATSAVDIVSHRTFETHELRHLIAIGGALLLCCRGHAGHRAPRTRRFVGRAGTPWIPAGIKATCSGASWTVRGQTADRRVAAMAQPPLPPQKAVRPELAISVVLPGTLTHGLRSATSTPMKGKYFVSRSVKSVAVLGAAALFTLLAAGTASAHVTVNPKTDGRRRAYTQLTFRAPNEEPSAKFTKLTIQLSSPPAARLRQHPAA